MIKAATLLIGWVFVPFAIIVVAWDVAKTYVEEKADE